MIIYKFTNKINNKIYIGQTVRSINERIKEHTRNKKSLISKAILKYGIDNFDIEVIDKANTIEELNYKECYWIKFYKCIAPNGYNQCEGGLNTKGYKFSKEVKENMKYRPQNNLIGKDNPFYMKKHTEEQKKKWSIERKGRDTSKATEASKAKTCVKVKNIDTGEEFNSIVEAAQKYNLKETHISRVCRGKRKSTGGFKWSYL